MGAAYSFLDVQVAISGPGGAFSIGSDAGASEEGITVEFVDDKNTLTIGAGGDAMHSLHAGKAGTATVRLLQTSPVNAQLQDLYNLQTEDASLHGQNTITGTWVTQGDAFTGRLAAFKKAPPLGYAKEGGTVEWIFDIGKLDIVRGAGVPDLSA